jgi:D-lactate dehydrogenase
MLGVLEMLCESHHRSQSSQDVVPVLRKGTRFFLLADTSNSKRHCAKCTEILLHAHAQQVAFLLQLCPIRIQNVQHPLFLEADPQDREMILSRFPDADILPDALEGDALVKACKGRDVVCCFIYSRFTAEVLRQLPDLRLLSTRSVGVNHIDAEACLAQGVTLCHVPDYGSHVIAEHVFALLLTALRHITEAGDKVRAGDFDYHGLRGMALMGKTIGIIGTGKIGRFVAKIAHGFGMRILAVDTCRVLELETQYGVEYVSLERLLQVSDIISLHLPALPDTVHLIDAETISQMKDGVIIINTARGELIDSTALLDGLKSGKIQRALLDVLEHEKDFVWNQQLIEHPDVIVTPHIAFYADDSMHRMYLDSFQTIDQWYRKESLTHLYRPPTVVCDLPVVKSTRAR